MCCSGAQWKREEVPDHKWDFVDVREFHNSGCLSYLRYMFFYALVIKSFATYAADVYTAVLMLASNKWAGSIIQNSAGKNALEVPFSIGKWIFFGCILFSFLLLAWEARKSRAIIRSRDISYAFTNVMANNYYSMKSYDHFCFFSNINNSKKKKDDVAFFVFFTFKGWKRLLLADGPRQVINGLTLYSFANSVNFTTDIEQYLGKSFAQATVFITMVFTVVIWIGSFVLLVIAALMYVPLLCYIQGNLKEYCCHKVDKRIAELIKRKTRKRLANMAAIMQKEAKGDFSHLKDKKGQYHTNPLPLPTLPDIDLPPEADGKSEYGVGGSVVGGPTRGMYSNYPPNLGYAPSQAGSGAPWQPGQVGNNRYPAERDYPSDKGYAHSIASTDHIMSHAAPIAGYNNGYGQYGNESHPAPSLSHAPSYTSQDRGHYEDPNQRRYAAGHQHQPPYHSTAESDYGGAYGSDHGSQVGYPVRGGTPVSHAPPYQQSQQSLHNGSNGGIAAVGRGPSGLRHASGAPSTPTRSTVNHHDSRDWDSEGLDYYGSNAATGQGEGQSDDQHGGTEVFRGQSHRSVAGSTTINQASNGGY